ncbi:DNAJ heat shock N-terminal domain-containing family protein [Rhynchospora pubera]|uniref:DNAJ heat shock N-terminal domain-containing family protein n=1 Tax=Rhynchospora pubera TaxID=906938 RepID=A0AAV8HE23_9POAL|nr:DNAJ heat shock N-terminal domain-containing family protein [Rhynchospora pubera]
MEAIRALEIAQKRLLNHDYAGAKEMALRANKLFPLYNNSQILAVREVHCSAQLMVNGLYDWYKVIQVEPLADEITIRKQYYKLAALLHPDKNKMPGAKAAFKLVREANRTLSDQAKRIMYHHKRKRAFSTEGPQQSIKTNTTPNSCSNLNRANKLRPQQLPQLQPHKGPPQQFTGQQQPQQSDSYRFTYVRRVKGTARILMANAPPRLNLENQPQQFTGQQQPQQEPYRFTYVRRVRDITRYNAGGFRKPDSNCPSMSNSNSRSTIIGQRGKSVSADISHNPNPCSKSNFSLDVNQRGDAEGTDGGNHVAGSRRPLTRSLSNKPDVEYSGTGVSSAAKKARGEVQGERDGDSAGTSRYLRRSSRYKPDVKYIGTCVSSPAMKPNDDAEKLYVYPDPDFHKFDMCRTCNKFQQGNIWALYSDLDTFPKYYGLISKVEHESFKVHINWLKACPKSDVERAWLDANLPISCGKFRVTTQNMIYDKPEFFSHIVSVRHNVRGNCYDILPGVGEIWAVYKNWSARWTCRDFKICKFDIVEIREQREDATIVWPLRQVPEFRSVFMPEQDDGTGSGTYKVPSSAYILFSHKIPAIRLSEESGGKLKGLWELDPASLPNVLT